MMRTLAAVLCACLCTVTVVRAQQTPEAVFAAAGDAYRNGAFDEAVSLYAALADTFGIRHADVYYNLANSCFRAGSVGMAIVNYERARRLRPRDDDFNRNLAFARMTIRDRQPTAGRFILLRWALELLAAFSCTELVWGASGMLLLLAAVLAWGIIRGFGRPAVLRAITVSALLFCCAAAMAAGKVYIEYGLDHGVVTASKAEVYSGPDTKYTLRFVLHEGTGTVVDREQDGWFLIRLGNGEQGWLRAETLTGI